MFFIYIKVLLLFLSALTLILLQVDIPNIQKQRKHLAKLVLDMDSARTRRGHDVHEFIFFKKTNARGFKCLNAGFHLVPTDFISRPSPPVTRARCSPAPNPSRSERRWRRRPIGWRFVGWASWTLFPPRASSLSGLIYIPPACIRHKRTTVPGWCYSHMWVRSFLKGRCVSAFCFRISCRQICTVLWPKK